MRLLEVCSCLEEAAISKCYAKRYGHKYSFFTNQDLGAKNGNTSDRTADITGYNSWACSVQIWNVCIETAHPHRHLFLALKLSEVLRC